MELTKVAASGIEKILTQHESSNLVNSYERCEDLVRLTKSLRFPERYPSREEFSVLLGVIIS